MHQTLPAEEIIVVDDNQDEEEIRTVRECVEGYDDPRLMLISNFRRKGGCGARNSGILTATGTYIAFLDDDDIFREGALQAHFNAFEDTVGMVYGNCQVVDDLYKVTETTAFKKGQLHFRDLVMGHCPPSSSVVMIKKSILLETGLFDESLPSFQDYDMWLKVSRSYSIRSHEAVVAKFIQHDGQRTSIDFDKRRAGLDLIVQKWGKEIETVRSLKSFINHFMAGTYFNSGTVTLSFGIGHRLKAFRFFIQAIRLKAFHRRYWKWAVFSLLGFQLTKKIRSIHP